MNSLLDIFRVEQKEQVLVFLKHIEARNTAKINKELEQKRKSSKKTSGTAVPRVPKRG